MAKLVTTDVIRAGSRDIEVEVKCKCKKCGEETTEILIIPIEYEPPDCEEDIHL